MNQFKRRFTNNESGQALVLVAVTLLGLLAMLALAMDGGMLYLERRVAQNAADAAVLAATARLGEARDDGQILSTINEYARALNGAFGVTGTYLPSGLPIGGGSVPPNSTGLRLQAQRVVTPTFAQLVGMGQSVVRAGAAARYHLQDNSCGGYVVWAHGTSCKVTLDWTGSGGMLVGTVHSNGSIKVGGSAHVISGTCEYVTSVKDNNSGISYQQVEASEDYPIEWYIEDYRPGGRAALAAQAEGKYFVHNCPEWQISSSEHTLAEGLHYCQGDVKISGSSQFGHVTIVAEGKINVSASSSTYNTYCDGLLFFSNYQQPLEIQCNNDVIEMQGSGGTYTGFLFAPNGGIKYAGSAHNVVSGGLIGYAVDVSGSDFSVAYLEDICEERARRVLVEMIE